MLKFEGDVTKALRCASSDKVLQEITDIVGAIPDDFKLAGDEVISDCVHNMYQSKIQLKQIFEPLKQIVERYKVLYNVSETDTTKNVVHIISIIELYKKILDILQVSEDKVLAEVDVSKSFKNAVQTHTPPKFKVAGTTVPNYAAFRRDWDNLTAIVRLFENKISQIHG